MRTPGVAASLLLIAFLLAYAPDVGHGFITDDFRWVLTGEEAIRHPPDLLVKTTGFFRPLVTLSFGLNSLIFGHNPVGYGVTNLLLVLACAGLIYGLCRAESLSVPAALIAGGTWMFNFHGINMAVLWTSGRTSLLATLFALLAARLLQRGQFGWSALCCFGALLSKEEAIALPLVLALWIAFRASADAWRARLAAAARAGWPMFVALAVYFVLRAQSDAFAPSTAPSFYSFTMSPTAVAVNVAHYSDRACTTAAIVAIVVMIAGRRRLPIQSDHRSRVILEGALWLVGGYAITVWLPVRSSLYAVFPSVGTALILGALSDRLWERLDSRARARTAAALLALPFLLNPVYRARNVRWVELADLSRQALVDLDSHADSLRAGRALWILDDNTTRANIRNAFGAGMTSALWLRYGVHTDARVVNDESELATRPADAVTLQLRDGRLEPHP
jgi:hypothetical protein